MIHRHAICVKLKLTLYDILAGSSRKGTKSLRRVLRRLHVYSLHYFSEVFFSATHQHTPIGFEFFFSPSLLLAFILLFLAFVKNREEEKKANYWAFKSCSGVSRNLNWITEAGESSSSQWVCLICHDQAREWRSNLFLRCREWKNNELTWTCSNLRHQTLDNYGSLGSQRFHRQVICKAKRQLALMSHENHNPIVSGNRLEDEWEENVSSRSNVGHDPRWNLRISQRLREKWEFLRLLTANRKFSSTDQFSYHRRFLSRHSQTFECVFRWS